MTQNVQFLLNGETSSTFSRAISSDNKVKMAKFTTFQQEAILLFYRQVQ